MLTETGRVVAVQSDCLWIETVRRSTCGSCSAQKACGHGLLNAAQTDRVHHVRVLLGRYSANDFQIGDEVTISIPERVLVTGALLVYILPLLTLLAGALLAASIWPGDAAALLGAGAGFSIGLGMVRWHATLTRNRQSLQPVVAGGGHTLVQTVHPV